MRFIRPFLLACAAVACASGAIAQNYPDKPIRIVVPFPAGGGTDSLTRLIAQEIGYTHRRHRERLAQAASPATCQAPARC